ncbi:hypothetical protein [Bacterioplanoides sp.]|uniref:hypothetical protein n=1 Tax=Bacterioplanoides sp. TaxID=2066072 RepID=UPI003B5CEE2C
MHYARLISLSAAAVIALVGCSGNSSTSFQESKEEKVTGFAGAANMASTSIQAISISNQGQPETAINRLNKEVYVGGRTTSSPNGFYQVVIDGEKLGRPTVVIASSPEGKARSRCELVSGCGDVPYLGLIDLGQEFEYRALVTDIRADMTINVNWLTHIANAFAYTSYIDVTDDNENNPEKAQPGIYTRYTIDVANKRMTQIFGIDDIVSTRPIPPSEITKLTELSLLQQQQGITYGALLAGIQAIKPDGVSVNAFLNQIILAFNNNKGQLLVRGDDGTSEISVDDLWRGAQQALQENIQHFRARDLVVPSVANAVLDDISTARTTLQNIDAGTYTNYPVPVLGTTAQAELNAVGDAKTFITDLNKRFINFDGSDPNTCSGGESDSADCMPSFVDLEYRSHIETYSKDMLAGLEKAGPDLLEAFKVIRNTVDYYASVLAEDPDVNNPLHASGRVLFENVVLPDNEGVEDDTNIDGVVSKKMRLQSGGENTPSTLTLSFAGSKDTPRKPKESHFFLFKINLEGKLQVGDTTFRFDVGSNPAGVNVKSHIEMEYESEAKTPLPFADEEPLTYKLLWPKVWVYVNGVDRNYDTTQYFEVELVGNTDPVLKSSEMRYNLKRAGYKLLSEESKVGDNDKSKKDRSEGVLTLSTSAWSAYYPENKWPDFSDFLTFRPGFDVTTVEQRVFSYFVGSEDISGDGVVQYLDLAFYNSDGALTSGKRYRLFPDDESVGLFYLQTCELDVTNRNAPVVSGCGERVRRYEKLLNGVSGVSAEQVAKKLISGIYNISGRGYYSPKFKLLTSGAVALLEKGQWVDLPGLVVRVAENQFEYAVGSEDVIDNGNQKAANFVDVMLKADDGTTPVARRYRQISIDGRSDRFNLQRCSLVVSSNDIRRVPLDKDNREQCDDKTEVVGSPELSSLASAIQTLSFTIPSRGIYRLMLVENPTVEKDEKTGAYSERMVPLLSDQNGAVKVGASLVAPVSLGIDIMTLRLAAELYSRKSDDQQEPIGSLIADVKLKLLAEDVFDIAITFGYKYDGIVGILPTGVNAQSFYVAYQAGFNTGNEVRPEELGSLAIFRGGVTLAGKDSAEGIGLFATSEANYDLTEADSGVKACGVVNRKMNVVDCDAVAYIGVKGTLLGVVREERKGVYVARFINGDFVILGK